jgi:hypothetical protein
MDTLLVFLAVFMSGMGLCGLLLWLCAISLRDVELAPDEPHAFK